MWQRHVFMIAFLGLGLVGCAGSRSSQSVPADSWVGLIYEGGSLPGGAEHREGMLIDTSSTLGVNEASLGGERFLLLDSLITRADDGRAEWKILDAVRLPEPLDSKFQMDYLSWCKLRGDDEPDPALVALVAYEAEDPTEVEVVGDVRAAWLVNIEARQFVDVDPEDVECVNYNYGYDG